VTGILKEEARKKPGKVNFIRVKVERTDGVLVGSTAGDQHTGILRTMVRADALALLPLEASVVPAGSEVGLYLLNEIDLQEE
jgi:molybdopterin molybdotransferase